MRYLFITVAQDAPQSLAHLAALLDSIGQAGAEGEMVLVLRGGHTLTVAAPESLRVHVVPAPEVIALSVARNLALEHARRTGVLQAVDAVAFPDDDCRYPAGALARAQAALDDGYDLVCGPYRPADAPVDRERFPDHPARLSPSFVMRVVASGCVFFRADAVRAVGDFDERFGLGARYGASEDSDYAIRALRLGLTGRYVPDLEVEHPYKAHRPAEYFIGNVAVLAKHAAGGTLASMLYRLAIGATQALRRRLPARVYGRALVAAVRVLISASATRRRHSIRAA